jgi:uncharacterized protein with PQ loop repeat
MVFFYIVVLRTLRKANVSLRPPFVRGLLSAAILGAAFGLGSWHVLGLVLGWAYIPQLAPAVWTAYNTPTPIGVSAGTWALIGIDAALWLVYGALLDDTPVVIFGVVGFVASVLILARVWATVGFDRCSGVAGPQPRRRS